MHKVFSKDSKTGKIKIINVIDYDDGGGLDWGSGGGFSPPTVSGPIFLNATNISYYTLSIHGPIGNEYLEIDLLSGSYSTSSVVLYNGTSNKYYSLIISGTYSKEIIAITSSNSTTVTPSQVYNYDTYSYYNLSVNGTLGNEYILITAN